MTTEEQQKAGLNILKSLSLPEFLRIRLARIIANSSGESLEGDDWSEVIEEADELDEDGRLDDEIQNFSDMELEK